ncbi:hypothetical protein RCK03_25120, partial [Salmonella enterica subsp. enterica serovar 1,4,[5],12:i:-]
IRFYCYGDHRDIHQTHNTISIHDALQISAFVVRRPDAHALHDESGRVVSDKRTANEITTKKNAVFMDSAR